MVDDDKWDCLNSGGEFVGLTGNFDNIGNSLVTMVYISQAFNWSTIMFESTRLRGLNKIPGFNSSP